MQFKSRLIYWWSRQRWDRNPVNALQVNGQWRGLYHFIRKLFMDDASVNNLLRNGYNKHQGKFASAITGKEIIPGFYLTT